MRLAHKLLLAGALLGASACKDAEPDDAARTRKNVIVETASAAKSASEVTEESREAREAKFKTFERTRRTQMFEEMVNDEGEGGVSFIAQLFNNLPKKDKVLLRKDPPKRAEKSPKYYLFDLTPKTAANSRYNSTLIPKANNTYGRYVTDLQAQAAELGLGRFAENDFTIPALRPFYESVRHPIDDDLRYLYRFFKQSAFARAVAESFDADDFNDAEKLIKKKPDMCESAYFANDKVEMTLEKCGNPKKDGVEASWDDEPGEGELFGGRLAYVTTFGGSEYRSASPFVKWLFRRGETFCANARILLAALQKSSSDTQTEDEFVEAVREKIPREEAAQPAAVQQPASGQTAQKGDSPLLLLSDKEWVLQRKAFLDYERIRRDQLFKELVQGGKNSFIATMLGVLPKEEEVILRDGKEGKAKKTPLHYFFDHTAGSKAEQAYRCAIMYDCGRADAVFQRYIEDLNKKQEELGYIPLDPDGGCGGGMDGMRCADDLKPFLMPFYESVRDPSDTDLAYLFEMFEQSAFARIVAKSVYTNHFEEAKRLRSEQPNLCPEKVDYIDVDHENYVLMRVEECDLPRSHNYTVDGELEPYYPTYTRFPNPPHLTFSDEKNRSASPIVKWLFRRGEKFCNNAQIMLEALKKTWDDGGTAADFICTVREKIPAQPAQQ